MALRRSIWVRLKTPADESDELIEGAAEEVVGALDHVDARGWPVGRRRCGLGWRTKRIVGPDDEALRPWINTGRHLGRLDDAKRGSDGHPLIDSIVSRGQGEISAEGPSDEANGCVWSLIQGLVDRCGHIEPLPIAVIVAAVRSLDAAEVEAKCGHPDGGERMEKSVDHAGVHVAAMERVRVAQDGGRCGRVSARRPPLGPKPQPIAGGERQSLRSLVVVGGHGGAR